LSEPQHIDPERLAALIDGRLGKAEATALRRQLAASDDDALSVFADAIAVTRALTPDHAAPTPIRSSAGWRRLRWVVPLAAAASLAAIIIWKPRYAPSDFAASVPAGATASLGPAWGELRGSGERVSDAVRAVRIGALLTDLEVDRRAGARVIEPAMAIASLLDQANGGSVVAASFRSVAADSVQTISPARAKELGSRTLDLVDADRAAVGSYLEALRLATASGDSTLLSAKAPSALQRVRATTANDPAITEAFTAFDARVSARPVDTHAAHDVTTQLLRALTR
jgi:hypothetical protein